MAVCLLDTGSCSRPAGSVGTLVTALRGFLSVRQAAEEEVCPQPEKSCLVWVTHVPALQHKTFEKHRALGTHLACIKPHDLLGSCTAGRKQKENCFEGGKKAGSPVSRVKPTEKPEREAAVHAPSWAEGTLP